jgi:hypothetical protein
MRVIILAIAIVLSWLVVLGAWQLGEIIRWVMG